MEIKVITRHFPTNYGSLLQSIATQMLLTRLGHNCEIIDYVNPEEHGLRAVMNSLKSKPFWKRNLITKAAYLILRYPSEKLAEIKFAKMRNHYLRLTRRFKEGSELSDIKADVFMTGSDQVWGPTTDKTYDPAYFLSFVKDGKKIAFASSFGKKGFADSDERNIRKLLEDYDDIAVREDTAISLLNSMGIKEAKQVLDPTLLIDKSEWNTLAKDEKTAKDYVLVYQLHNNPDLEHYALEFSKKVGLPLKRVSPSLHQFNRGGKFEYLPSLGHFLSLIKNCKYLITDSFHGTAFAINFNKQFIEIMPNNGTGGRNQSILKLLGLSNRIVQDVNDFSIVEEIIDYNRVNQILAQERKKSIQILGDFLKN